MKEELPNPGHLMTQIAEFLSSPVMSNDGGYAPVGQTDWESLNQIIEALILLKWGPDSDGDRPVNYCLANKHRERFVSFPTLPYAGDGIDSALRLVREALGAQRDAQESVRQGIESMALFLPAVYAIVDDKSQEPLEQRVESLRRALYGAQ